MFDKSRSWGLVLFRELMGPGIILVVGSQSLREYGDDS